MVKMVTLLLDDSKSIEVLWYYSQISQTDDEILFKCSRAANERVFHGGDSLRNAKFIYMYENIFDTLSIRILLTDFECDVLNQENFVPPQLHLNSWAFIHSFKVLVDFIVVEPSINVFFFFFSLLQSKGIFKGL